MSEGLRQSFLSDISRLPQEVGLILIQNIMSQLQEAKMTSLKDKQEAEELARVEAERVEREKALRAAKKAKKKKDD